MIVLCRGQDQTRVLVFVISGKSSASNHKDMGKFVYMCFGFYFNLVGNMFSLVNPVNIFP